MLLRIVRGIFDAFSPTPCAGCDQRGPICPACASGLEAMPGLVRLGRGPWVRLGPPDGGRLPWQGDEPGLELCLGPYLGLLQRLLVAAKRGRHPGAAPALAARLASLIARDLPEFFRGLDGILVPPPSPDRLLSHPAPVLARALAAASGLPLLHGLVQRRTGPVRARWLDRASRPAHVGATFLAGPLRMRYGSRILLVDDLITTGATLAHLRRLLALRGLAGVRTATFAEAPRWASEAGPEGEAPRLPCKTGPSARVIGAPGPGPGYFSAGSIAQDPERPEPFG